MMNETHDRKEGREDARAAEMSSLPQDEGKSTPKGFVQKGSVQKGSFVQGVTNWFRFEELDEGDSIGMRLVSIILILC